MCSYLPKILLLIPGINLQQILQLRQLLRLFLIPLHLFSQLHILRIEILIDQLLLRLLLLKLLPLPQLVLDPHLQNIDLKLVLFDHFFMGQNLFRDLDFLEAFVLVVLIELIIRILK
jgi:hypothetical protein